MLQKFGQINPTAGKMRKSVRRLACADGMYPSTQKQFFIIYIILTIAGEHPHFLALAADLAALLRHSIFVDHARRVCKAL